MIAATGGVRWTGQCGQVSGRSPSSYSLMGQTSTLQTPSTGERTSTLQTP